VLNTITTLAQGSIRPIIPFLPVIFAFCFIHIGEKVRLIAAPSA
jgi:hypothetical protein